MSRSKTYIIRLTNKERSLLGKTIQNKNTSKTVLKRCQILLDLDELNGTGQTQQQIADTYVVCMSTISKVVKSYAEKGVQEIIKYHINPTCSRKRKVNDQMETKLIQIASSPVPEGHTRWSLRLLEEKFQIELESSVSRESIRKVLKKMNFDLTTTGTGAF